MKLKLIGAASALALGLAICGAAAAQTATNSGVDGDATATNVDISGLNENSILSGNDASNQNNDYSQANSNSLGSYNELHSGNTALIHSENNNSNQDNNSSDNSGQDNSVNVDVRANLTEQVLSGNVSNVSFNASDTSLDDDKRRISSGDLSYSEGAFQGWAGIQTAATNTGVSSNNLAATSVSANANVNFGSAGAAGGGAAQ